MSVQERLLVFLKYKRLSKLAFANSIGRSPSYVTNIVNTVGNESRKVIEATYPELNMEWLLFGNGEMIKTKDENKTKEESLDYSNSILVIPVAAQAGRLSDFADSVSESDCEKMISPINGADFAIPVSGDSMSPEYPSGTKVIVKKINHKAFIDWGRTYVLDTCNGVVIKNIYPGQTEDTVRCVSINPNFPSFEIEVTNIYGWYRVLMSLSLK
jgi:phage repressor protein C with HTH and peptisase S24 domain